MFCGICRPTYSTFTGGAIRHGEGSGPTTGHQNRSAVPRNSACSRRWAHSFSSARSNSGEKWLAHITPANSSHETTGKAKNLTIPEWSTGRIQRLRVAGELACSRSVIGPANSSSGGAMRVRIRCWTMCTLNSVVS